MSEGKLVFKLEWNHRTPMPYIKDQLFSYDNLETWNPILLTRYLKSFINVAFK